MPRVRVLARLVRGSSRTGEQHGGGPARSFSSPIEALDLLHPAGIVHVFGTDSGTFCHLLPPRGRRRQCQTHALLLTLHRRLNEIAVDSMIEQLSCRANLSRTQQRKPGGRRLVDRQSPWLQLGQMNEPVRKRVQPGQLGVWPIAEQPYAFTTGAIEHLLNLAAVGSVS